MSTTYVLDTNSFRVFGNYYPESFPSFWDEIEKLVADGLLVSCREVAKEMEYVAQIFRVPHFRQLIGVKQQLKGSPVADPFLVARGALLGASVVTEETLKPNAAKLPNVCEHFGVRSTNVQGFLVEVGWRF